MPSLVLGPQKRAEALDRLFCVDTSDERRLAFGGLCEMCGVAATRSGTVSEKDATIIFAKLQSLLSVIGRADALSGSGDPLKPIVEPSLLSAFSDELIAKLVKVVGT